VIVFGVAPPSCVFGGGGGGGLRDFERLRDF
jgi:hypothetical protein